MSIQLGCKNMQNDTINNETFLIAVFTYNNLEDLESTVRSLYLQTYPDIALYVSDDHSSADRELLQKRIESILAPYKNRFIKVTININTSNLGTVRHINSVLHATQERYICLLGSGDRLYSPNTITEVWNFFRQHTNFKICTSKRLLQLNGEKTLLLPPSPIVKKLKEGDMNRILNLCCRDFNYITTIGTFFLRDLFDQYGEFDERYVLLEDAPYFLNLLLQGEQFGFLDKITCVHLAGGISNRIGSNPVLEKDSCRTLGDLKYPHRFQLTYFSRRVVTAKYLLRIQKTWRSIIKCFFLYPDAILYLLFLVTADWIKRKRFFIFKGELSK